MFDVYQGWLGHFLSRGDYCEIVDNQFLTSQGEQAILSYVFINVALRTDDCSDFDIEVAGAINVFDPQISGFQPVPIR